MQTKLCCLGVRVRVRVGVRVMGLKSLDHLIVVEQLAILVFPTPL